MKPLPGEGLIRTVLRVGVRHIISALLAFLATQPSVIAQDLGYSPYANLGYPIQVLWGDTHLHTSNSFDARMFGVTLDLETAYRFARGETVISNSGQPARLGRPLDFLVVADHSDALGVMDQLIQGNPEYLKHDELRAMREKLNSGGWQAPEVVSVIRQVVNGDYSGPLLDKNVMRSVWEDYVMTADRFNEPGQFTAMIGYEWTPTKAVTSGDNLHRNVLYRDGANIARRMLPFTAAESINPQALWQWMQRYEDETGGRVLALAHNGNLSNGLMFPVDINPDSGAAIDSEYVKTRARWEPLYEVTQIKGDGEAHPYLSPTDEFAEFEQLDHGNAAFVEKKTDMLQYEYAREALKNGLKLERALGDNPYQFGMVGSTDSHTGLATADENNFFGKTAFYEPGEGRLFKGLGFSDELSWKGWELSAAGYAAVWAQENTRESIWDAMQRREVYATTGPRMTVRFFGGWAFEEGDNELPDLALTGYSGGVPMGSTLPGRTGEQEAPSFLISALKDPDGANLDRVQVIKGWLDKKGETQEKVYDVVWSDGRQRDAKGKLPPVGNTVHVGEASYRNSIGAVELATVWRDPDFDATESAFYYMRVIEIPTPRWTTYDARIYEVELPGEVPRYIQERAYTSPIWYTPPN